ncbi:4-hydroxyphenylpyruvate dioxygenase [Tersicoccus solisilvae]|uniref:3-dehydroshikimate dehydratase n=1 Tax=Tersicoccus solisilvae TaxID=1882339 RepID=A0ABQ1NQN2_9MICC|nr:sugar phosphate isomerase/epimerase and 4-hydroxyphenylpyruvate domain-containing protein [Tersicoccus solisilvae]GGC83050.1 4-hydroxyphenylpyruvate dioxygenase [Tersicoccus solisilvae]
MRTSIATVCMSGSLEEKLHASAGAGFDGVEIFEQDLLVNPASPEEVRALADRLDLRLNLYQPFRDFEGVEERLLAENLRRAEAKFSLMNRLGIDTMLVCSNVATAGPDDDDLAADHLRRLGELAAGHGVRVAYEALAWGKNVSTYRHAQHIVELADHPAVGTCLDSFHILSRGDDPAGIEDIDPERIFFVQLADAPTLTMDALSWSRHHRLFPGQGGFDLAGFLAHLVRGGYGGPVSLEIFNDTFRQSDVLRTALDGMRSLLWLQDRTRDRLAGTPEPAGAGRQAMTLTALPRSGGPAGHAFTDIRTDDADGVGTVLAQLGFRFRGQHRRKPVQLWEQGGIRMVIDGQRARGVAPSISALGLAVADPAASADRASMLAAPRVPRQNTPDEEALVGVLAPDGTEIFFAPLDPTPAWADEFGPAPGDATSLLTAVDHVNLAQPWQAFDEAVLFFESTLGLSRQPTAEVPSPRGLVRSQVMRTEDGCVRLALNMVPHVLDAGAYPEHIAFATSDVVAVARRARAAGMAVLPVPANYYEDLAARFPLDPDEVAVLRELDLLYDREGDGEYLHFYTETVGTLFFEVVERRHGYDGHGAANAPVRLAAQFALDERRRTRPPHPVRG